MAFPHIYWLQLKGRYLVFFALLQPMGTFSLREKVRMRGTRSKNLYFFHSLTLASSDYAKDKLSRSEREFLHS